jgi:hypothetical protein
MCFWFLKKSTRKEVAKFISGAATMEIISHTILATSSLLPMHFFGLMISKTTNLIILIGWIIVFISSIYCGWIRK